MDKIFKQRFEKFEKKAPDHILENLLNKIEATEAVNASSASSSFLKVAIWTAVAVATVVTAIVLLTDNADKQLLKDSDVKPVTEIAKDQAILDVTPSTTPKAVSENSLSNSTQQSEEEPKDGENTHTVITNNKDVKATTEDPNEFNIIATRSTCNGECILEIDQDYIGEWTADKTVFIASKNNPKTVVRFEGQGKVIFSYTYNDYVDTFAVFFYQPINLTYDISDATCGEVNGKVEFSFPSDRQFSSTTSDLLKENSFENLAVGTYAFKLEDNHACAYSYSVEVKQQALEGEIIYNPSETRINTSLHLTTDVNIEGAEYVWDFGDGTQAYTKDVEHQYEEAGIYTVTLQVNKNDCSETLELRNLEIKNQKAEFKIPNIFTPNNDGKNDVFLITAPEDLKSFEGIIMNRDGLVVFQWTDPTQAWDGLMLDGQEAKTGTYYYVIKGVDAEGEAFEYKSFVELQR